MRLRSPFLPLLTFALAAFASASVAPAAVVTYFSASAFASATNGDQTYTIPTASGNSQLVPSPYTIGPLTFASDHLGLLNDGKFGAGQTYLGATLGYQSVGTETISLSGATALSFILGSYFGASTVSLSVDGVLTTVFDTAGGAPTTEFLGLTSTTPITSLSFTYNTIGSNNAELDVLRFTVGNNSAVPEPSSWGMLGLGMVGAGVVALRRRQTA